MTAKIDIWLGASGYLSQSERDLGLVRCTLLPLSAVFDDVKVQKLVLHDGVGEDDDTFELNLVSETSAAVYEFDIVVIGIDGRLMGVYDLEGVSGDRSTDTVSLKGRVDRHFEDTMVRARTGVPVPRVDPDGALVVENGVPVYDTSNVLVDPLFFAYFNGSVDIDSDLIPGIRTLTPYSYIDVKLRESGGEGILPLIYSDLAGVFTFADYRSALARWGIVVHPGVHPVRVSEVNGEGFELTARRLPVYTTKYPLIEGEDANFPLYVTMYEVDNNRYITSLSRVVTPRIVDLSKRFVYRDATYQVPDRYNGPRDFEVRRLVYRQFAQAQYDASGALMTQESVIYESTGSRTDPSLAPIYLTDDQIAKNMGESSVVLLRWDLQNKAIDGQYKIDGDPLRVPQSIVTVQSGLLPSGRLRDGSPHDVYRVESVTHEYDGSLLTTLNLVLWQGSWVHVNRNGVARDYPPYASRSNFIGEVSGLNPWDLKWVDNPVSDIVVSFRPPEDGQPVNVFVQPFNGETYSKEYTSDDNTSAVSLRGFAPASVFMDRTPVSVFVQGGSDLGLPARRAGVSGGTVTAWDRGVELLRVPDYRSVDSPKDVEGLLSVESLRSAANEGAQSLRDFTSDLSVSKLTDLPYFLGPTLGNVIGLAQLVGGIVFSSFRDVVEETVKEGQIDKIVVVSDGVLNDNGRNLAITNISSKEGDISWDEDPPGDATHFYLVLMQGTWATDVRQVLGEALVPVTQGDLKLSAFSVPNVAAPVPSVDFSRVTVLSMLLYDVIQVGDTFERVDNRADYVTFTRPI